MIKKILLVLFFAALSNVSAQSSTARFLYWSTSAETAALGGAGSAIPGNSFSAFLNPAGLAFQKAFTVGSSFYQPFSPFDFNAQFLLTVSHADDSFGALGMTMGGYWSQAQLRTGNGGYEYGVLQDNPSILEPTNFQYKLSYAKKIKKHLSAGMSFSVLGVRLANKPTESEQGNGETVAALADFGILFTNFLPNSTYSKSGGEGNNFKGFSFGLSILNLGPDIFYIDEVQADPPPSLILLGISYSPFYSENINSRVLIDFEKRLYDSDDLDFIHTGGEVTIYDIISLRLGYQLNNINNDSFFTYGAGIRYRALSFNIARFKKYILTSWQFDVQISSEL